MMEAKPAFEALYVLSMRQTTGNAQSNVRKMCTRQRLRRFIRYELRGAAIS
jgi:hypothetical protein